MASQTSREATIPPCIVTRETGLPSLHAQDWSTERQLASEMWGNIHSKLAVPMAMRPELSLFHVPCDLVGSLKLLLFCLARQIAPTSTSSEGLSFPSWTIHVLHRPSSSLKSPVTACHSSFVQQPPQVLIASSAKLHNRRTPHSASARRERDIIYESSLLFGQSNSCQQERFDHSRLRVHGQLF